MTLALKRLLPSIPRLAITLMVALTLAVPAAYLLAPHLRRWQMLHHLTADDPAQREQALNYVIRRAPDDARVRRGAIETLGVEDRTNFLQLVAALENAGLWSRRHIPADPWLRWLTLVAASPGAEAQVFAANRLADLTTLADDPRVTGALGRLLDSDHADARYNALVTAAALMGGGGDRSAYEAMIASATSDPEPEVARHAWVLLGLLDPVSGHVANWHAAPPPVAAAILWATVRTNPGSPGPAIAALRDPGTAPTVRAAAAYALHQSDADAAIAALLDAADVPPADVTAANQLTIWRAILGLPRPDLRHEPYRRLENVVVGFAMDMGSDPLVEPLALAAVYRMGIAGARRQTDDHWGYDAMLKLATVEGQQPPYMRWPLTGDKPPLLRVLTVAVDAEPHIGDLRPAFESALPTLRDLAAVVAADKFEDEKLAGMAESLLRDYNDHAKMGGAILAGLAGVQRDLLHKRAAAEDVWAVQQVMRLGLWMQGEGDAEERDGWPSSLLMRDDVPRTTVLLAMMHRGRVRDALDHLLAPRGQPPVDLVELLAELRWWHVLRRYLPDDAPPFWLWADPQLKRFQIDVLRDWWLLNRGCLTPAPLPD